MSTRNVDALVVALGGTGISKSEVSRICGQLDEEVGRFRTRRLDAVEYPYVFLDATYLHVRTDHLVTSKAVVVATAVAADGRQSHPQPAGQGMRRARGAGERGLHRTVTGSTPVSA